MTTINLIPQDIEQARARRFRWKRWSLVAAASGVLAMMPIMWRISQRAQTSRLTVALEQVETERSEIRAKLAQATARAEDLSSELERSRAFRSKRSWSGVVGLLAAALPPDCWLMSLATDPETPAGTAARIAVPVSPQPAAAVQEKVVIEAPRKLRLVGYSTNDAQPLTFVANLKESKAFSKVALQKAIRAPGATAEEALYQFEVVCEW